MFCPRCGSEYGPEFTRCSECDVDLVSNLPQIAEVESEYIQYEEVLSIYNPGDAAIIKSLLDGEGITYFFQGETVAPYLFNAVPMRLLIKKDEIETAREILKDVDISITYSGRFGKKQYDEE